MQLFFLQVNDGFRTWRKPSILLFGGSDPFISIGSVFEFLEVSWGWLGGG
jgi:hypothetical protein